MTSATPAVSQPFQTFSLITGQQTITSTIPQNLELGSYCSEGVRPLHVFDLPDEILFDIFLSVKDWTPPLWNDEDGHTSLKNVRVSCQRFCNISSELLIDRVVVEMNQQSLTRLENISSHPSIRKGVQVIRVMLHYYCPLLADSITEFAGLYSMRVSDWIDASWMECRTLNDAESFHKLREIATAWQEISDGVPITGYSGALLREIHEEYCSLFTAQESLRHGDLFLNAIAIAYAKLPACRNLDFTDQANLTTRNTLDIAEYTKDKGALLRFITQPFNWGDGEIWDLGSAPVEILLKLPQAIKNSSSVITCLSIDTPIPDSISDFPPNYFTHPTFALQNLQSLSFIAKRIKSSDIRYLWMHKQEKGIRDFLSGFLGTSSLQKIVLDFSYLRHQEGPIDDEYFFSLGSILILRPWENLSHLKLVSVSIEMEALNRLADYLPTNSRVDFEFHEMMLSRGTWQEALDILRPKAGPKSVVRRVYSTDWGELSHEEGSRVFDYNLSSEINAAEAYLRGYTGRNPFFGILGEEVEQIPDNENK